MTKNWISIATAIIVVATGIIYLSTRKQSSVTTIPTTPTPALNLFKDVSVTPEASVSATITPMNDQTDTVLGNVTELKIEDLKVGTGTEAVVGKTVTVNYRGTLINGTEFDSSYKRNQPFTFNLGAGMVIAGWDQGVVGMKVGGKRKLTIPPSLGYGNRDMGTIPPNSTLIFEIDLLKVD